MVVLEQPRCDQPVSGRVLRRVAESVAGSLSARAGERPVQHRGSGDVEGLWSCRRQRAAADAILPCVPCLLPECDADAWPPRNRWNRERPSGPSRQIGRSRVEKASIVVVEPLSAAIARTSRAGPAGQDLPLADLTGCFVTATETPLQTGLVPCRESSKGRSVMTTTITPLPNSPGRPVDPPTEAHVIRRVRVHQYNDSEILEFFNRHGVEFQLVGDHLFIIRSRKSDLAAGPGDWLVAGPDGEVDVQRGDYALRAQRAITRARKARRERSNVIQPTN